MYMYTCLLVLGTIFMQEIIANKFSEIGTPNHLLGVEYFVFKNVPSNQVHVLTSNLM